MHGIHHVCQCSFINDEYRKEKSPSLADYRKKLIFVFDHQIPHKLATDVNGCLSTRNDMNLSGAGMEPP